MEIINNIIEGFSLVVLHFWIGYLVAVILGRILHVELTRMNWIREVLLALGVFGTVYIWGALGIILSILFLSIWLLITAIERKDNNTYYGKVLPEEPWGEPPLEPLKLDAFKNTTGEYLFQIKKGQDDNWYLFDTQGSVVYVVESDKFKEFNRTLIKILRDLQDDEYEEA